jgi:XrtJ-associated TM-motif-TM protein
LRRSDEDNAWNETFWATRQTWSGATEPVRHQEIKFEDTMILKKILLAFGLALMLTMTLSLRAQTGCEDSPEDPTIFLALVGGAGAIAASLGICRRRKE